MSPPDIEPVTGIGGEVSGRPQLALADALGEIAVALRSQPDVEQTVDAVAAVASAALGCLAAGVMLLHGDGRIETVAATDSLVAEADRLQIKLAIGPCVAAIKVDSVFRIADTLTETRWPEWCAQVGEFGYRSVLGVVMDVGSSEVRGALNVYDDLSDRFDDDDVAVACLLARHAALAVATAQREAGVAAGGGHACADRPGAGRADGAVRARGRRRLRRARAVLAGPQHEAVRRRRAPARALRTARLVAGGLDVPPRGNRTGDRLLDAGRCGCG